MLLAAYLLGTVTSKIVQPMIGFCTASRAISTKDKREGGDTELVIHQLTK